MKYVTCSKRFTILLSCVKLFKKFKKIASCNLGQELIIKILFLDRDAILCFHSSIHQNPSFNLTPQNSFSKDQILILDYSHGRFDLDNSKTTVWDLNLVIKAAIPFN